MLSHSDLSATPQLQPALQTYGTGHHATNLLATLRCGSCTETPERSSAARVRLGRAKRRARQSPREGVRDIGRTGPAAKAAGRAAAGRLAQVQRERVVGELQAVRALLQRRQRAAPGGQLRIPGRHHILAQQRHSGFRLLTHCTLCP